jgi:hypothetical protein
MSPAEWSLLPDETYSLRAEISLTRFNARTSFQTNASTSTTATMNNQLWLNFSPSVMNKFPGVVIN